MQRREKAGWVDRHSLYFTKFQAICYSIVISLLVHPKNCNIMQRERDYYSKNLSYCDWNLFWDAIIIRTQEIIILPPIYFYYKILRIRGPEYNVYIFIFNGNDLNMPLVLLWSQRRFQPLGIRREIWSFRIKSGWAYAPTKYVLDEIWKSFCP